MTNRNGAPTAKVSLQPYLKGHNRRELIFLELHHKTTRIPNLQKNLKKFQLLDRHNQRFRDVRRNPNLYPSLPRRHTIGKTIMEDKELNCIVILNNTHKKRPSDAHYLSCWGGVSSSSCRW